MSQGNHERRRAPRVVADFPIQFRSDDGIREGRVRDLSEIGLSCTFPGTVEEMTVVKIGLRLPDTGNVLELEGAVVRCEPLDGDDGDHEVAVYFTNHPEDTRDALREWVSKQVSGAL